MTDETTEAVVIGGGVIGCAVLLELATRGIEAILVEAEPDVGEGASKANSAIIHTGFDAKPGTHEARLLRRSAERWPQLLEALGVPSLACGALMVGRTDADATRLREIASGARDLGVEAELVDAGWLRREAPYVDPTVTVALHIPDESIVDPFWLTRAYAEAAIGLGATVRSGRAVTAIAVTPDGVKVRLADGATIRAGQAFDCAGIRADEVAALAGDTSFSLTPRKGQFLVSEHDRRRRPDRPADPRAARQGDARHADRVRRRPPRPDRGGRRRQGRPVDDRCRPGADPRRLPDPRPGCR